MSQRFFIVDVEATTRSPHSGVMTEFGVVELRSGNWFHGVLYQSHPSPTNPAIPVLSGTGGPTTTTGAAGVSPKTASTRAAKDRTEVFTRLHDWVDSFGGTRATLVSDNPGFDAAWMAFHADEAGVDNIFGHSSRRIGDLAAGLAGSWCATSSWKRLRRTPHTHHPVDDAVGNAEALRALLTRHNQKF